MRPTVASKRRADQMLMRIGRLWLPARSFAGLDNNGTADISLSQGTPTLEPLSGTWEIAGIPMTTADEAHTVLPIPFDWDIDEPVAGRIWFVHASTDASDAPVYKVGAKFYGKQAQTVEMQANADVVTTITHPGTVATDDSLEITNWTSMAWNSYVVPTDILAGISVELDNLGSSTADECEFIGLELAYQRIISDIHHQTIRSFVANNPL